MGFEGSVGLTFPLNCFFVLGTEPKSKPRPSKNERVSHPEELSPEEQDRFLGVDVVEWYYPFLRTRQEKKCERIGHPPQTFLEGASNRAAELFCVS